MCSNSYGSMHLENEETAIACSSEGGVYVSKFQKNNEGVFVDKDLVLWLARISNSIVGCPEHRLSYLNESIQIESILGKRDEDNLLCTKFPIQKEDNEEENE